MAGVLERRGAVIAEGPFLASETKNALPADLLRRAPRIAAAEHAEQVAAGQLGTVPLIPAAQPARRIGQIHRLRLPRLPFIRRQHDQRQRRLAAVVAGADDAGRNEPAVLQSPDAGDAIAEVAQIIVGRPPRLWWNHPLAPRFSQVVRALEEDAAGQALNKRKLGAISRAEDG